MKTALRRQSHLLFAALLVCGSTQILPGDEAKQSAQLEKIDAKISIAAVEADGCRVHTVESPYQAGTTKISILLPDRYDAKQKYRVVYVLPVEALDGSRWGKALDEVKRLDLHNKHRVICVYPTFSHVPWYADHPTDAHIRQETYFLKAVVPFVEREYPVVAEARGRLLVGFSKSGWGAFTLLLRHPETFGRAAAWDSPFEIGNFDRFQIGQIYGTQENLEKYRVTSLLREKSKSLQDRPRLILAGASNFASEHASAHKLMDQLEIRHTYFEGPKYQHAWEGGWLPKAFELVTMERD